MTAPARRRPVLLIAGTLVLTLTAACGVPAPPTPVPSRVAVSGTRLTLDGRPWTPVGVNAYSLATVWGTNPGCGTMYTDAQLDEFFASLPTDALVRTWAFQGSMATNFHTGQRDWTGLDRVVRAAERHRKFLLLAITNQSGGCDDNHWKDPAWYRGGYTSRWPGDGYTRTTTSFDTYLTELVTRYRSSPAVAIWEPVNEPEGAVCAPGVDGEACFSGHLSCPDRDGAAAAMREFFDRIGPRVRALDPGSLVSSGAIGGPQCGWEDARFEHVHASPGIDIASYHDYSRTAAGFPDWPVRVAQATGLGKPLLIGELGLEAGPACRTTTARADQLSATTSDRIARGAAGVLFWNRDPAATSGCDMTLLPGDPALTLLR